MWEGKGIVHGIKTRLETKLTYIQANLRTTVGFNVESWIETDRARQRPGR